MSAHSTSRARALRVLAMVSLFSAAAVVAALPLRAQMPRDTIPLPEQPRPDFARPEWLNLNGTWAFRLDPGDTGRAGGWWRAGPPDAGKILEPFSWASPASGVADTSYIGWYARDITLPASWEDTREDGPAASSPSPRRAKDLAIGELSRVGRISWM